MKHSLLLISLVLLGFLLVGWWGGLLGLGIYIAIWGDSVSG